MIRPTDDPNQTDLVAGYILEDLSPEEVVQLNQALAEDPTLHQEIGSFGEAFSSLSYDLPILEPSARLKDKIISAASHSIPDQNLASSRSKVAPLSSLGQRSWKRWIPAIGIGFAATVMAALGLNQIQLSQQLQQAAVSQQQLQAMKTEVERLRNELQANQGAIELLSQPDTQMYSLMGTTDPNSGRISKARLLTRPGTVAVTLVAQDLPKLPNNQIYRLWAVATPTAAPMYCGQFRQNDRGTAQWVAPNVACTKTPKQLLITLDAPTDPTTAAGPLVMKSSI
jgi:Anti-sigma-K factor rskA